MLPYFFILFIVMLVVFVEKYSINRRAFLLPSFFLILFAAVRSEEVGADTKNYTLNFNIYSSIDYYNFNDGIEWGYKLIEYFILYFTKNYFWLFFTFSCIIVLSYLYVLRKYSLNYSISIFTFICFGYYTFFFNGLRQGVAMAIASLSLIFLVNKEILKYLILILIASLFHKSALILIPFYFLVHLNINFLYKAFFVFLGSFVLSPLIIKIISLSNERYASYSLESENSGGFLTLIFYFLIGFFSYFIVFNKNKNEILFNKIFQLYSLGVIFLIPIALLGASASGPQRLLFYFSWLSCLIIPYLFIRIKHKPLLFFYGIFCIIYFYLTTTRFSLLVPYSINDLFRIF
ncbi:MULTISPECIES: EpsG family protein [Acinetobacter]|uniref:EpsG family protein n=1 Tax=Acinetobacter TaxID=469 RepID=UPI0015D2516E|nr:MULTISPECIES: EpsG family protein [Acinetobacter]